MQRNNGRPERPPRHSWDDDNDERWFDDDLDKRPSWYGDDDETDHYDEYDNQGEFDDDDVV